MNPRVAAQSVEQLRAYLQRGNPCAGMPALADLPVDDLLALARDLRRINVETIIFCRRPPGPPHGRVGSAPTGDWRTYNGSDSANRYSSTDARRQLNLPQNWLTPRSWHGSPAPTSRL
jgi:hypothetical protein